MLSLAYSPCPNDTFIFNAIASGDLTLPGRELEVHLHDIETLNELALKGEYCITKVSFHAWLMARERYRLLSAGAALGFGCGPVVVSRRPITRAEIPGLRTAVPGRLTTAHLLFRLWAPDASNRVFGTYDEMMGLVSRGEVDCAVVIHEGRFVYEQHGLHRIVDLGEWWRDETGLPIPLAGIAIRKDQPEALADEFDALLRKSIAAARRDPDAAMPYIRRHAQEMAPDVLAKHIATFVNEHSLGLGDDGLAAVEKLEAMATAAGVIE